MEAAEKYDRFVKKYLKRTKMFKTLEEFQKSVDRKQKKVEKKPVKLSFAIQKASERKKIEKVSIELKMPKRKLNEEQEKNVIPKSFKKMATKFGLPAEHWDFFYEERENFHWETIGEKKVYCTIGKCDFSAAAKAGSMVEHMIENHDYGQFPCTKPLCKFEAYSPWSLNKHLKMFHGSKNFSIYKHNFSCQYCPFSSKDNVTLDRHVRIHENRLLKCQYCNYATVRNLPEHIFHHFRIRNFQCDICEKTYLSKGTLTAHKREHTRDFCCLSCNQLFERRHAFDKHVKNCKVRLSKLS